MVRLLIVEDSPVVREFLCYIFESNPDIEVVGTASNGLQAVEEAARLRPDIITMDINMPKMNGLEATREIMELYPTPIIIVSGSHDPSEVETTFRAVEAGALAMMARPVGVGHPDFEVQAAELVETVKLMAEVKVVRRNRRRSEDAIRPAAAPKPSFGDTEIRLVAIGASTGGPIAVKTMLCLLPPDFKIPIAVVQHMAVGFIDGYADWLAHASGRRVRVVRANTLITEGEVYVAPDDAHMVVDRSGRFALTHEDPVGGLRPAVSLFFRSVGVVYGPHAVGVLLTGMGKDGAADLKLMRDHGALTFAQDEASCVVFGMPGEAKRIGAATYVLPPEEIAAALGKLRGPGNR